MVRKTQAEVLLTAIYALNVRGSPTDWNPWLWRVFFDGTLVGEQIHRARAHKMWEKWKKFWKGFWKGCSPMEEDDAIRLFRRIQSDFPELEMDLDLNPEYIELEMHIPQQPGLAFKVNLNLQNGDELHLHAGESFWGEWFSSAKETVVDKYYDAVTGLLSGQNRIIEYYQNDNLYKAKLQTPIGDDWKTIGTRFCDIAFPWGKTTKILQNVPLQDSDAR